MRDMKYYINCPMCDNKKCVRGTPLCEAEQWQHRNYTKAKHQFDNKEIDIEDLKILCENGKITVEQYRRILYN